MSFVLGGWGNATFLLLIFKIVLQCNMRYDSARVQTFSTGKHVFPSRSTIINPNFYYNVDTVNSMRAPLACKVLLLIILPMMVPMMALLDLWPMGFQQLGSHGFITDSNHYCV
jgi:hypothetical protein